MLINFDYVFDTNAFSQLFHSYYRKRFPTLWRLFDELIEDGKITSTKEVAREIEDDRVSEMRELAKVHKELFPVPTSLEADFVVEILSISHFQQIIEKKKILKGGKNADLFIIAGAKLVGATVVTQEKEKKNAAKIPNICHHFNIQCTTLEGFMELEKWEF